MLRLFILVGALFACVPGMAQDAITVKRAKAFNVDQGEPAIGGYDPVSYFMQNKAVKGRDEYSYVYQGIKYRFSNAENLSSFKQQPGKYEPQYGGWCAFAMGSDGTKVEIDPETFRIYDGKLYLFYNRFFNNTLKTWMKSEPALRKKADANWPKYYSPL